MSRALISFADKRLWRSLRRLEKQAVSMDVFDELYLFNENNLGEHFLEKHGEILNSKTRGFGYWIWKPEVILTALSTLDEGDVAIYVDVGCHLNANGKRRLEEYINLLEKSSAGIIAFTAQRPTITNSTLVDDGRFIPPQINKQWIKGDLLDYFGVRDDAHYYSSEAIGATIILIKKSEESVKFINEWKEICESDYGLIDDSASNSPNLDGFIEHRHDQAVFTLLAIKYEVELISAYEYWYPTVNDCRRPDWLALGEYPFHAKRDKDFGWMVKQKNRILKVARYVFKYL